MPFAPATAAHCTTYDVYVYPHKMNKQTQRVGMCHAYRKQCLLQACCIFVYV